MAAPEKLGPYMIAKTLGRGGMGAVYAGVNEQTGEKAAVKVLSPHLCDNPDFRERFIGEVETLKKLKHPNIVQLFAYGQEDDNLFYVMELVEGRSLQDELSAGRRFEWREVARIGVDVCRALKHAHDSGVIHRDLKPANLLIDKSDQVKLTDFGIAKLYGATNITAAGGILGTADYMAPEQAEGKPVTVRSDLYSLGSVLYALLCGRPPFTGKSLAEVIHGLRFDKPIPPCRLAPNTPVEFEAIILQLLDKEPARRIASAFAVANLLRAMEHALSLETQVGQVKVADVVAPHKPGRSSTRDDAPSSDKTVATNPSGQGGNLTSVTIDIAESQASGDDYRLTGDLGSAPTSLHQGSIHRHSTLIAPATLTPKSRFVTVEEEQAAQREQGTAHDDEATSPWLVAGGLVLLVLVFAALLWFGFAPPGAEQLHARIAAAAADDATEEQLLAAEGEIRQFLSRFATDTRAEQMAPLLDRIEMIKMQRQFDFRARLGFSSFSPVEQAYVNAVRLATSDPQRAIVLLEALVDVFQETDAADPPLVQRRQKLCVELARRQAAHIRSTQAEVIAKHRTLMERALSRAQALEAENPSAAESIRRGLAELYGDQPWAAELLKQAD